MIVLGRWTHDEHDAEDPDATVDVRPGSLLARLRSGEPIARDRMDGEYHCIRLAAPVRHVAAVWGALIVVATDPHEFAPGAEERLQDNELVLLVEKLRHPVLAFSVYVAAKPHVGGISPWQVDRRPPAQVKRNRRSKANTFALRRPLSSCLSC